MDSIVGDDFKGAAMIFMRSMSWFPLNSRMCGRGRAHAKPWGRPRSAVSGYEMEWASAVLVLLKARPACRLA